jgi:hypothetical protein
MRYVSGVGQSSVNRFWIPEPHTGSLRFRGVFTCGLAAFAAINLLDAVDSIRAGEPDLRAVVDH